jgi:aminobenzoyl-glutamate utilization protein B
MQNTDPVWDHVEARKPAFIELSDQVFDTPETLYREFRSAAAHRRALADQGFRITAAPAGIPTAVIGEAGEGGPVIAILGEYDALPGLSQQPGVAEHTPDGGGRRRAMAAATTCWARPRCWPPRRSRTGWPKPACRRGCAITAARPRKAAPPRPTWCATGCSTMSTPRSRGIPASFTAVNEARSLANTRIDFTFHGKAAHAAGRRSWAAARWTPVELMNIGVNYLREHMPDDARVHYAYLDAGGEAPNVVQARATVRQLIRAQGPGRAAGLVARVRKIADGAALMTETRVETRVFSGSRTCSATARWRRRCRRARPPGPGALRRGRPPSRAGSRRR